MKWWVSTVILSCCVCLSKTVWCQVQFTDRALEVGIDTQKEIAGIGQGVSFRDFNGDGWDDLTLATEAGKTIDFYVNHQGTFSKVEPLIDNQDNVKQILWVDFDNDGDQDLYLATREAANRLYERLADGELMDVTELAGLPTTANNSFGAVFGDFNRDGWLDLYYSDRKLGNFFDQTETDYNQNQLYANNGDGTFRKVTTNSGTADPRKIAFCSAFFDYNNDGWPDIYTANDKLTTNTLLRNEQNCTFSDVGEATYSNARMNAMCVAVGDYNNDGWQDLYVTNTPSGNTFLMNLPNFDGFQDVTTGTQTGYFGNGWGSIFLDGDNDGFLDLYVSGSMVGADKPSNIFYHNMGNGVFEEGDFGFEGDTLSSYANAYGDYNEDGYPDIIVQNNVNHPTQLWEATPLTNRWLKVRLTGVVSNRDAIGSLLTIYTGNSIQTRYTHCGIGFLGQNSRDVLFGLGSIETIDSMSILWPSGHVDVLRSIASNHRLEISEGQSTGGAITGERGTAVVCREDAMTAEEEEDEELILGKSQPLNEIVFYPNPAVDFLTLSAVDGIRSIRVTDLSGKVLMEPPIQMGRIDVSHLRAGAYLLQIEGQQPITSRFVKR